MKYYRCFYLILIFSFFSFNDEVFAYDNVIYYDGGIYNKNEQVEKVIKEKNLKGNMLISDDMYLFTKIGDSDARKSLLNKYVLFEENNELIIDEMVSSFSKNHYKMALMLADVDNKKISFKNFDNKNSSSYDLNLALTYFTKNKSPDIKLNAAIMIEDIETLNRNLHCYNNGCEKNKYFFSNYSNLKYLLSDESDLLSLLNLAIFELRNNFVNLEKESVLNLNVFKHSYNNYVYLEEGLNRPNNSIFNIYGKLNYENRSTSEALNDINYIDNVMKLSIDNVLSNDNSNVKDLIYNYLLNEYGEIDNNLDFYKEISKDISDSLANYLYFVLIEFSKYDYHLSKDFKISSSDFKEDLINDFYNKLSNNIELNLINYLSNNYSSDLYEIKTNSENSVKTENSKKEVDNVNNLGNIEDSEDVEDKNKLFIVLIVIFIVIVIGFILRKKFKK